MGEGGFSLGGEQSGHVIMSEYATTGDGILTGLHLVSEMARQGKSLAELASIMTVYPQVLVNVKGVDRTRVSDPEVAAAVAAAEAELGDSGRVLLRASGTEQLVRVMVEAADAVVARQIADRLAASCASVLRSEGPDARSRREQRRGQASGVLHDSDSM